METYHVALGAGLTGVSGSSARGADVVDGWSHTSRRMAPKAQQRTARVANGIFRLYEEKT